MALTFKGGVFIPEYNTTKDKPIKVFVAPKKVTATEADHKTAKNGATCDIKPYEGSFDELKFDDIIETLRKAGIPEYKKIAEAKDRVDTLIINCVEAEPGLSVKHDLIIEDPDSVLGGVKILLKALGLRVADIAVEDSNPDVIRLIREKTWGMGYAEIKTVKSKYPQDNEALLVYSLTGKEISAGGEPTEVECIVFDALTCVDIYNAFVYGMPSVSRVVAVGGDCVTEPCVVRCPIGVTFGELIDFCGRNGKEIKYLIDGTQMTGKCVTDQDCSVTRDTVSVFAFSERAYREPKQASSCIRCGRCVNVCPMSLMPNYLAKFAKQGKYGLCEKYGVMSCIGCGCCSYVCPAGINIKDLNLEAKSKIKGENGDEEK